MPKAITYDDLELIVQEYYEFFQRCLRDIDSGDAFPSEETLDRLEAYDTSAREKLKSILTWLGTGLNQHFITHNIDEASLQGLTRIKMNKTDFMICR